MTDPNISKQKQNIFFEPIFYFGYKSSINKLAKNQLSPKADFLPVSLGHFFEYQLRLNPDNLSCHLQRIEFFLYRRKIQQAYTALCDLFIVLGNSGEALRQRLWQSTRKLFDNRQVEMLEQALKDHQLMDNHPLLPAECLFRDIQKYLLTDIITLPDDAAKDEDILLTADSYIENSQFDAALDYISKHLQLDSGNKELTSRLLYLYKALNLNNEFQLAYQQYAQQTNTAQLWNEAKAFFEPEEPEDT